MLDEEEWRTQKWTLAKNPTSVADVQRPRLQPLGLVPELLPLCGISESKDSGNTSECLILSQVLPGSDAKDPLAVCAESSR